MSAYPPPPPMRHSSAYHERQRSSNSSSPAQFYPPPPPLSRPPPAHVTREGSSHRERQGSSTHPKASISSATSGSSGISESKYPSDRRQNRHGSQAERGLMDKSPSRESGGPHRNNGTNESNFGRSEMVEDHSAVIRYIQHDDIDDEPPEKDHAIWILFWLSFLDPFHSVFSCIYTLFALLGLITLTPIRIFQKGETFSTTLIRTIAPVYRNHLQMIYAPSVKKAHTFDFSPTALIFTHLAAPIVSLALTFFAWIAAVFWLFALIMGNPDGTEKRDDGRATVLGARNYLERYLLSALKNKP